MSATSDPHRWKRIDAFKDFFRQIAHPSEDYELGLAYSVRLDGDESYLLSYNPRRRTKIFRKRIVDTLRGFGLPTEAVEEADSVLAPDACSWVLGLEFQKNQSLRATVYIEEIAEYLSRETLARLLETIRSRNGLPQVSLPSVGTPYILALDIHPEGARHLKLYSFIDAHTPANLGLKAPEFLFEPSAPRLLQNRSGCNGQKIYRCYPYLQTDTPEAWVDWATAAGQFNLDPSPFGRMPITSIGARFVDSDVKALSLYGCVVRPKG